MEIKDYVDDLKLQLTGAGILESELKDEDYEKILDLSLKEINRYYNATELLEVDGESCIDLKKYPRVGAVMNVFRSKTSGLNMNGASQNEMSYDPVQVSQLQLYNFGSPYQSNDWVYNYTNYALVQQTANTFTTDLNFREDRKARKLYVTFSQGKPNKLTIEYVPILKDVSDVVSEYWQDILMRLSLAHAKIILGRIRTRYTQSNALWTGDGDAILSEGREELAALRDRLRDNSDLVLPVD